MEWTPEVLDRVVALRLSRVSWPAIAQELDTSRSAVLCAMQRSGRTMPDVGTVMPRRRAAPVCDAVAPETRPDQNANAEARRPLPPVLRAYPLGYALDPDRPRCTADHWGKPCGRTPYRDGEHCLGHTVLALRDEYKEGYMPKLAMLTETVTPRRLADAIRVRIETQQWRLAYWSAMVGLLSSTAYKAIMSPDDHPKSFAKIALYFGYVLDAVTGTYRKKKSS